MNAQEITQALASTAFRYALRQIAVFPLAPGSKCPMKGSRGLNDASVDPDATRVRWQRNPRANIGAATGSRSGFWVLDVDAHHDGPASLAKLEDEPGPLPVTVEASTPNGGRHLYWRWQDDGPEIRNSAGRIGPGLDVRGEGGSIILPPSVLADGRCYRWAKNGACTFADAPEWLVKLALPPPPPPRPEPKPIDGDVSRYVGAAVADELCILDCASEGTRNLALFRTTAKLAEFVGAGALPEDWARDQLKRAALGIGLDPIETRRTIDSGFNAGIRQPRELPR